MKLVILHGAPATGKFTIAQALEKLTKFKLIHIHSMYDFLESIFSKERYEVSLEIFNRTSLDIFEQATKEHLTGLIYTYAEFARDDFAFMKEIVRRLEGTGTHIDLVHLSCRVEELHKRIANTSRKEFTKTTNSEELTWLLEKKDYDSTFPGVKTLEIDTAKLTPTESAKLIAKHYSLSL
ncbi:TPA: hypothetical protein DCW61_04620 [Candidatus Uhrbacteria bacterium]|nr:hypothetical protein [Candidatus Uhrbacteria bacterium]